MKIVELEKLIQSIRLSLQGIYQQIKTNKSTFLPSPDASVIGAGEYIQQEQYDVVVCGQFKKGKSSFINALLGEEVLPVATEVATAQVFRVINSDTEDYNLVFNNGERIQGTGIAESAKLSPWAMWSSKWNSLDVSGWIGLSAGLRF